MAGFVLSVAISGLIFFFITSMIMFCFAFSDGNEDQTDYFGAGVAFFIAACLCGMVASVANSTDAYNECRARNGHIISNGDNERGLCVKDGKIINE